MLSCIENIRKDSFNYRSVQRVQGRTRITTAYKALSYKIVIACLLKNVDDTGLVQVSVRENESLIIQGVASTCVHLNT